MSKKYSKQDLQELSLRELAEIYNQHTDKPIKKFSGKNIGVARTAKALKAAGLLKGATKGERKPREMRFILPVGEEIKETREGTKRAELIRLLSRKNGATFQECQEATGWDKKTCYEGIRLLHYYCGYGLTQDDKGHIFLLSS